LDKVNIGIIGYGNTGMKSLIKQLVELNSKSMEDILEDSKRQELLIKIKTISNIEDISKYENLPLDELNCILKFLLLGVEVESAYEKRFVPNELIINTTMESVSKNFKLLDSIEEINKLEDNKFKNNKKQKNWNKKKFYE
jgi:hypothetical protein